MKSLYEITGKKRGILIYTDDKYSDMLITDWNFIEGVPGIYCDYVQGMNEELELLANQPILKEDIKKLIERYIEHFDVTILDTDFRLKDGIHSDGILWIVKDVTNNNVFQVITINDWE